MSNKTLQINKDSIENELASYKNKPFKAIFEYIWNSFDAAAKVVEIKYQIPDSGIGYINELEIIDDGIGWDLESRNTSNFLASDKSDDVSRNKSLPRGKLGRGRYVFIWYCEKLTAISKGKKTEFNRDVNFQITNADEYQNQNGTKLLFAGINEELSNALKNKKEFQEQLLKEFGWFLYELPAREIVLNGERINVKDLISKELTVGIDDFEEEIKDQLKSTKLECKIVLWNDKPNEYAKFYFVNSSKDKEKFISTTSLNKKRDEFWHSVYIYSDFFEETDKNLDEEQQLFDTKQTNKIKKKIIGELKKRLIELRKPLLSSNSEIIINEFKKDHIIPNLEDFGIYDNASYEDLLKQVYTISPSIFVGRSKEEQSFMCSVFASILSSSDSNLIQMILEQLNEMTEEDKENLKEILHRSSLTNITRTIKEIDKRICILENLKELLFIHKNETLEVEHLQEVLNDNVWIFGENYRLFSDTEGALKNTLKKYAQDILRIDPDEVKTNSRGELDLFIIRDLEESDSVHRNIVVEIKRPKVKLGKKEYDQIEKYANDILKEDVCNGDQMYWEFILVGNDYDEHISNKIENARNWGEKTRGLTVNLKDGKSKIYIRKWSDIINVEQGHKMKYLKDKLAIKAKSFAGSNPTEITKILTS